jgi:multidrug efflux pump subunit AcrA (membrane-fusion protein)
VNLNYALEQRKLEKEESIFEAPSARRTADIEYEKAKRALDHSKENYVTKVKQAQAKMQEVTADLNKEQNKYEEIRSVLDEFTILAPENGMVIYAKEWGSEKKIIAGSSISSWAPTVATLPDLTMMQSKTYVSEVDIQKVKEGLEVSIGLDADPNKRLRGKVMQVANIGEQQQGSDSKWFEVIIEITTEDLTLRPAMTSSNKILISTVENSIFIRQECVTWEDSLSFVLVQSGNTTKKVPVKLGMANENEVVVLSGLNGDENLLLSMDEEADESKENNQKGNK